MSESTKKMVFYHGSNQDFLVGEILKGPEITGKISEKGRKKNLNRVFFTLDKGSAQIYAGRAVKVNGGYPQVYIVKPLGPVEWLNKTKGTTVLMAPSAQVVQKIY